MKPQTNKPNFAEILSEAVSKPIDDKTAKRIFSVVDRILKAGST